MKTTYMVTFTLNDVDVFTNKPKKVGKEFHYNTFEEANEVFQKFMDIYSEDEINCGCVDGIEFTLNGEYKAVTGQRFNITKPDLVSYSQ